MISTVLTIISSARERSPTLLYLENNLKWCELLEEVSCISSDLIAGSQTEWVENLSYIYRYTYTYLYMSIYICIRIVFVFIADGKYLL